MLGALVLSRALLSLACATCPPGTPERHSSDGDILRHLPRPAGAPEPDPNVAELRCAGHPLHGSAGPRLLPAVVSQSLPGLTILGVSRYGHVPLRRLITLTGLGHLRLHLEASPSIRVPSPPPAVWGQTPIPIRPGVALLAT